LNLSLFGGCDNPLTMFVRGCFVFNETNQFWKKGREKGVREKVSEWGREGERGGGERDWERKERVSEREVGRERDSVCV